MARQIFDTVFAAFMAFVVAPVFLWFMVKGLRSGSAGPQKLPATRIARPVLYWTYLVSCAAGVGTSIAFPVFFVTYQPGDITERSTVAMLIAVFSFGLVFATVGGIIGYYTVIGFRTGTGVVFGRGGPFFSERDTQPLLYWLDQVLNTIVAIMLGTIGLGAIVLSLLFALCAPPLG